MSRSFAVLRSALTFLGLLMVLVHALLVLLVDNKLDAALLLYVSSSVLILVPLLIEANYAQRERSVANHVYEGFVVVLEGIVVAPLQLTTHILFLWQDENRSIVLIFNPNTNWNVVEPYLMTTKLLLTLTFLGSTLTQILRMNQEMKGKKLLLGLILGLSSILFRVNVFALLLANQNLPIVFALLIMMALLFSNIFVVSVVVAKGDAVVHVASVSIASLIAPTGHAVGPVKKSGDGTSLSELERTKLCLSELLRRERVSLSHHLMTSLILFVLLLALLEFYGNCCGRWIFLVLSLLWIISFVVALFSILETKRRLGAASKWLQLTPHRARNPSVRSNAASKSQGVNRALATVHSVNSTPSIVPSAPAATVTPKLLPPVNGRGDALLPHPRTLARLLIPTEGDHPGTNRCNRSTCVVCTFFIIGPDFMSESTGKKYKFMTTVNCATTKVVYLVTCGRCRKQYVGKTEQSLKARHYGHRREIELGSTPLGLHFARGCGYIYFRMQMIDRCEEGGTALARKEGYWIQELKTLEPYGINSRAEQTNNDEEYSVQSPQSP